MMAAPARKKQKISPAHFYLDITEKFEKYPADIEHIRTSFNQMLQLNQNLHPGARSVIESIQRALPLVAGVEAVLSLQASTLSLDEATNCIGIDFELGDPDYRWTLQGHQKQPSKPLSEWAATTIQNIRRSKYLRTFRPESAVRTLLDVLICDRLELLDDRSAAKHLKAIPEVQMEISTKHHKKISGRADWTLGYMDEKDKLQEMLVVIEAKARGNIGAALPQLLIYLGGIQDARSTAEKTNKTVFGMATDSDQFIFAILQGDRKAFVSKTLDWLDEKDLIVLFLDNILRDAIESSPHTTPTRTGNKRIKKFEQSLGTTYTFGDHGSSNTGTDNDSDFGTWNVVEINGVSLLQLCEEGDGDNEGRRAVEYLTDG
ncbi:hypothetical protein V1520DRAFT_350159 [Lipomyces starkeyi]|uniref:Uncharacterized protein n=1 Tax=Lipomyces starkeyi NRRL Y-11557 TaxID=675824 RepID=A0A1E3PX37_LIPST|nr:hypothetical protein LIPSTDRAFT_74965 [Lipomyces starkeyi NRRL Y-11557]